MLVRRESKAGEREKNGGHHSFAAFLSLFAITELLLFCLQVSIVSKG